MPEAFVVVEASSSVGSTFILARLSSLPGYALPEICLFHRAFPRTPEGLVDFELLEKYDLSQVNWRISTHSLRVRVATLMLGYSTSNPPITPESDFLSLEGVPFCWKTVLSAAKMYWGRCGDHIVIHQQHDRWYFVLLFARRSV
ncbi:hypothetical protein E1B28_005424 [Marasmius oreades]|uniref:Uncharacterized protein n=1 Tax=Marasmius oreades TaxID=181124 RepID=A0A9P7S346_9AGAR|nr:uncharacterized protein E1B28_005424 [Marasmius oreades]KAG7094599.1 hypothetical protein E1B28_005424 [Marasmius oreades]